MALKLSKRRITITLLSCSQSSGLTLACTRCQAGGAFFGRLRVPATGKAKTVGLLPYSRGKMLKCPYCEEDGFDDQGLEIHLSCYCMGDQSPLSNSYAYRNPTKYAPDVAPVTSAEPLSGLESVPAVESDTQPRG